MVYNSFLFIWLFPIIFMVGNNLTVPYRKYFFLIVSYGIYIYYNKWMTLTLITVSLISYFFAKYLERNQNKYLEKDQEKDLEKKLRKDQDKKNCGKEAICGKGTICAGVIATILPLVVFKYGHFISENLSSFTDSFGFISDENQFSIIAPLGISFFTFQALSYVFDVYRKKYPAEQNLSNYLTYMAFFPTADTEEEAESAQDFGLVILKSVVENGEEFLATPDTDEELNEIFDLFTQQLLEDEE